MGVFIAILVIASGIALLGWFFLKDDAPAKVDANAAPTAPPPGIASLGQQAAKTPGVPVYDETYKVWTIEDPVQGKMWHQESSNTWLKF